MGAPSSHENDGVFRVPRRGRGLDGLADGFLFSGATAPQQCQEQSIGPSTGAVVEGGVAIIAGVAIGTVVLGEVHKSHHQVKGCVSQGANGLEARTDEGKIWALSGDVANLRPGDVVKVHGNRVSRAKNAAAAPNAVAPADGVLMFFAESLKKDYGVCKLAPAGALGAAAAI